MAEFHSDATGLIDRPADVVRATPVFRGTRVAVGTLVDYLAAGQPLDELLTDFPTVTRAQADGVLALAAQLVRQA
jgi:uncharacterized protein (DUF433 family)